MARLQENLIKAEPWTGLVMGNHALARAMIEAKVQVVTTYPGSPTPEIAAALDAVPAAARPYYFEYSTNEKVATEIAAGAALNGHLACVFFKSVGLNVAADTLIQLSLMELIGGLVVILGDDPGANSSQNEQDNRHFSRMGYIPMLEPATPQEAYEMFGAAAELSRQHRAPVFLRMTTHVCHAKEEIEFGAIEPGGPDWTGRFDAANGPYVPIAATVFPLKERALGKLAHFTAAFGEEPFAQVTGPADASRGVISAGLPALSVRENLAEAQAPISLLKLGGTYPLPVERIAAFMADHDEVLIVEELDRVMETEIKALAFDRGLKVRLHARRDRADLMGELTPERTWKLLAEAFPDLFALDGGPRAEVPAPQGVASRLPQMCPGCGHRSAFHAIARAIDDDVITVADIGCHSLGFMPPYNMGEVLFCMGHSTPTASGLALGNTQKKVLAFIGDSTLFHAGLPGIINAIVRRHNVTLVVLENGTTAMTGHQPRAGSGEVGAKIPLAEMFKLLGVEFIRDVDTYRQAELTEHVRAALEHEGLSIVIARHPCMLKFTREQRAKRPDLKFKPVAIDQATCNQSRICIADFGCPSFIANEDGTVTVHTELCIGDGSCQQTCPVGAIERTREKGGD